MMLAKRNRGNSGTSLLFVLWVIVILSFLIFSLSEGVVDDYSRIFKQNEVNGAKQFAERGLAVGSHALVLNGDPVLEQQFSNGEGFSVVKSREGALININSLAEQRPDVLERVFLEWGAPIDVAQSAADALTDWVDANDLKRGGGAESIHYARLGRVGHPYNRRFFNLSEVLLVDEFRTAVTYYPEWQSVFTVNSVGNVDLEFASREVIKMVTGAADNHIDSFIDFRNGSDGQAGTLDDGPLNSLEDCFQLLNIMDTEEFSFSDYLTFGSQIHRITSRGFTKGIAVDIVLTFRYSSGRIEVFDKTTKVVKN